MSSNGNRERQRRWRERAQLALVTAKGVTNAITNALVVLDRLDQALATKGVPKAELRKLVAQIRALLTPETSGKEEVSPFNPLQEERGFSESGGLFPPGEK